MNLGLHHGWPGALEAGAIAFAIGLLAFLGWHLVARRCGWPEGRAFGWACVTALVIGAGVDLWHLFRLFWVNPGSPARVQLALAGIHDPEGLGSRVVMEVLGAMAAVVLAWMLAEARAAKRG